jgi:hypothetical protein
LHGVHGGLAFYTGQEMSLNDSDKDVYGLLAKDENGDHESFSILGEAFIKAEFINISIKAGRQEMDTPFVNTNDNRLTPQSNEACILWFKGVPKLGIFASYVSKIRGKTDTEFVSMTEYAEVPGEGEPVVLGGLIYEGMENLKVQVWGFHSKDFFNEVYFRADCDHPVNEAWTWSGSAQYLSQKDTGDQSGGSLVSYTYAVESGVEAYGFGISAALAQVGDDEILIPWGHDLLCSIMLNDAVRPEETGILGTVQYDFCL